MGQIMATVEMYRDQEIYDPPYTANVHTNEVENWKAAGWRVVEKKKTTVVNQTHTSKKQWP